ncbi:hypothetical protein FRC05_004220 [Tulasnella sp. 425]|nr:hypothetical protein FRC05_004220 [Tulasnella sp. 425]
MPKDTRKQPKKSARQPTTTRGVQTRSNGPAGPVGELPKTSRVRKAPYLVPGGQGLYVLKRTDRKKQRPTEEDEESGEGDGGGETDGADGWNGIDPTERLEERRTGDESGDEAEQPATTQPTTQPTQQNSERAPTTLSQFRQRIMAKRSISQNQRRVPKPHGAKFTRKRDDSPATYSTY